MSAPGASGPGVHESQAANADRIAGPDPRDVRPGLFLMINSFETGGSERQFAALTHSLDPQTFRLHLGCVMQRGALRDEFGDVPTFGLGGSLYKWQSVKARFLVARHLRAHRIQIAHAFDFYTNLTLIPAARLAGVPVVIGSQRQLGDLLTRAQSRVQSAMFRWCDAVVCNSRAAADLLIADGLPASKIVIIGNGLPPSAFAPAQPALPRIPGRVRVGMIARMNTPSKNHKLFLRAAARLCNQTSGLEFVLAGDGPLRAELEREAETLGIKDQVCFLGDRRDIPAVLASLDISVLPSASESLSNVILESMAAGVPVVASRVGGNIELLAGGNGILVQGNDESALASGIEQLVRNPEERLATGVRAKTFAEASFSLENMRMRHEQLYMQLLERKGWKPKPGSATRHHVRRKTDRLRVAIIAASLRYVGGQSVQADLLLRKWEQDPDVDASFIPIDPAFPRWLRWAERLPGFRTLLRQPLYVLALWRGLRNADIAHVFSASYWSFLLAPVPAWLLARLRGKKVVIHYHSGEARDHLNRFRSARRVLVRADRLVVPSGYLVDVFREFGLKAEVVPNIVDLSQFSFRLRSPVRPRLVCTRGFHPYYSIDVVVRAFAEVKQVFPEAELALVGGGPTERTIRDLVRQMKLSGVQFTGVASREQIGRLYDESDIFINASCLDNMPVSVLEAFASGTPVVSTAPESLPYMVEHERTGLLSPVADASALARNVVRVLTDAELARRLTTNASSELEKYAWPVVRGQWLELYRGLGLQANEPARELVSSPR